MSCRNCSNNSCTYKNNEECRHDHHEHHDHHDHHKHHDHHGHHHHDHGFEGGPDKKELILIIVSAVLFAAVLIIDKIFDLASLNPGPANWVLPFVCYFFVYLILGRSILKEAAQGVIHGELLDENFLMSIASLGAFALGIYKGCIGEAPDGFEEGCAVVILYSVGEFFQDWALGKSRKSVADLMDLRPDVAHVFNYETGETKDEEPEHVKPGTLLLVKKGEKVPIDGTLESGGAVFDTMALTGESGYENKEKNDDILSGSINMSTDSVYITTTREYANSTVAKILHLVDSSAHKKAKTEDFIARFAKIYTPIVVALAVLVSAAPPLFGLITGGGNPDLSWSVWIYRGLNFLVVSCPCALVISIPLSYFMGIGTAGRNNILIKGSSSVELMSKVNIYVSDKTGTLTFGRVLKVEAKDVIDWMHRKGSKIHVLSGDKKEYVEKAADELGIDSYSYGLLPEEKVEELEKIMEGKKADDVVAYLGDGINDAPSLIRADIGISMGSIGSDAAVEASDIVLMKDDLRGIPLLHKISERTMKIVWENIIFSIGIKIIVLVLSFFGITNMWFAVFADVGVALLAVLNALRVGLVKPEGIQK